MDFPDNSFDLVWARRSRRRLPDKKKYVEEMVRVLKPGGTLVIATWCQRDDAVASRSAPASPLTNLNYLYKEWAHPYFISIDAYAELVGGTGKMGGIGHGRLDQETIASWRPARGRASGNRSRVFQAESTGTRPSGSSPVCLERMLEHLRRGAHAGGMIKAVKTAR